MKVSLRQRTKNGNISMYLDYYHKGKRKLEYLRLYLIEKPRTAEERSFNKKTLQLAENIRAKRQLELQSGIYGFEDSEKINSLFLTYFELLAENRRDSGGNYGNWLSALKHLKNWNKSNVRFADIDRQWLEDLKHYLVYDAKTKQGTNLSKNSCASYFNKVRSALKEAVKDEILLRNPGDAVTGITEAETKREFLTLEELNRAVKAHCEIEILKNAFIFSALTGLRFSDIEKLTWSEIQHSDEIGYSPDKMLQGRILSYSDAHRHRLGVNYEQIPVNKCPYQVSNYQRDGAMRVDGNGEDSPNYSPNSFDDIYADQSYKELPMTLESNTADWYDRNGEGENDHFTQAGLLFTKALNDFDRNNLVSNIVGSMSGIAGKKKDLIVNRQLCHFFRADAKLGMAVAKGLGVDADKILNEMNHPKIEFNK